MSYSTDQTKQVTLVSSRPPQSRTVAIRPDDTASMVLERAGLDPMDMLLRPGDQDEFAPTELPFGEIPNQGKLHAVGACDVGVTR